MSSKQGVLFSLAEAVGPARRDLSSTFAKNMKLPVHRWFKYSAGFSADWVSGLIEREKANGRSRILDPMCGSATVLLGGEASGVGTIGVEAHPFVVRVGRAKLLWREDPGAFRDYAFDVLESAKALDGRTEGYPPLIQKCFPPEVLLRLDTLQDAWRRKTDESACAELTWLALASILRACSPVGTAQWQYVLPNKSKAKAADPYEAFAAKVGIMVDDMTRRQRLDHGPRAALYQEDARECASVPDNWAELVITSPPYANNFDYADATRLEMSFFGDVGAWGDLQEVVRKYLVRSCTQHVSKLVRETDSIIADPAVEPIRAELGGVCERLGKEREKHGGKKNYHTMIAAYFKDMGEVWKALRRVTAEGSLVCYVVGDSAPYGVYVPVDDWLGRLAIAAGFKSYAFEKTRDRNVKWKNRKHRVPLQEGRLWVKG